MASEQSSLNEAAVDELLSELAGIDTYDVNLRHHDKAWEAVEKFAATILADAQQEATPLAASSTEPTDAMVQAFIEGSVCERTSYAESVRDGLRAAISTASTAPAEPEDDGLTREQWIAMAERVYLAVGDDEKTARELANYLFDNQYGGDEVGEPYDEALSDIEGRPEVAPSDAGKVPELSDAAQAVVARWDTPLWKDAPATAAFINRLRDALASRPAAEAQGEAVAWQVRAIGCEDGDGPWVSCAARDVSSYQNRAGYQIRALGVLASPSSAAAQAVQADAEDAARYRWLARNFDELWQAFDPREESSYASLDAAIDAARAQPAQPQINNTKEST